MSSGSLVGSSRSGSTRSRSRSPSVVVVRPQSRYTSPTTKRVYKGERQRSPGGREYIVSRAGERKMVTRRAVKPCAAGLYEAHYVDDEGNPRRECVKSPPVPASGECPEGMVVKNYSRIGRRCSESPRAGTGKKRSPGKGRRVAAPLVLPENAYLSEAEARAAIEGMPDLTVRESFSQKRADRNDPNVPGLLYFVVNKSRRS